jgi:hypothetical protein
MADPKIDTARRRIILAWARHHAASLTQAGTPADVHAAEDAAWADYKVAEAAGWIEDYCAELPS